MSAVHNLRKAAKRWLKEVRNGDPGPCKRLRLSYPNAPAEPGLRDIQHALALERGHESWKALKAALALRPAKDAGAAPPAAAPGEHDERVARFLEFACWDHHVHGKGDHRMCDRAAQRLLGQHPDIAGDSLYTAVVCGEIQDVERLVAERPDEARDPGGARGWTPLLYLCYTRFTHQSTIDNAVAIGRLLLDRGANPNDFYMAGDARYSALVGVAGEGEQDSPRQPQAQALFQLLLERGAEPFDMQILYNTHFSGDVLWWLELADAHTVNTDRAAAWKDPDWTMLDMGGYGSGARFLLELALEKRDLRLAEWLLAHGANPNAAPARDGRRSKRTLHEEALVNGFAGMAALLVRHGATPAAPVLDDRETFLHACFRLDRDAVRAHLETHPEDRQSPEAIFAAARRDRADVVGFLLDLGVPIEVEDPQKQRTLHVAAAHNARRVADLLVERGAEIDPREIRWGAAPIGFAAHHDHAEMFDFLSRFSRDVFNLALRGCVDRLRDVLGAQPELARTVTGEGITPFWWLPDDEAKACAIVELLLAHGADPSIRNQEGRTAADSALKRGMRDVSARLAAAATQRPSRGDAGSIERLHLGLEHYESLARDLLVAYESGYQPAMQRLGEHYHVTFTWDELRAGAQERLRAVPSAQRPSDGMYEGYFGLDQSRLLVAREAGFENWASLANAIAASGPATG